MSNYIIKQTCDDGRVREFNTSPKACAKFTHFLPGNKATLTSGYEVIIFGVAPTACDHCVRRTSCSRKKDLGEPSLWVRKVDSGELIECDPKLLPKEI